MNDKNNLIFTKLQVRAVNLPLNNPIVAHIGTYEKWPYICVDVYTKSGIIEFNKMISEVISFIATIIFLVSLEFLF